MTTRILVSVIVLLLAPASARADEYRPSLNVIRAAVQRPPGLKHVTLKPEVAAAVPVQRAASGRRSGSGQKKGLLIGLAVGAAAGFIWAQSVCDNDGECSAIANPVGIGAGAAAGAGIGALVGWLKR